MGLDSISIEWVQIPPSHPNPPAAFNYGIPRAYQFCLCVCVIVCFNSILTSESLALSMFIVEKCRCSS